MDHNRTRTRGLAHLNGMPARGLTQADLDIANGGCLNGQSEIRSTSIQARIFQSHGCRSSAARSFLVANTFFGGLPAEAVTTLMKAGHVRCYVKGSPLFERGQPADSLILIVSGRIKISNVTVDGREVVLNFLGTGDIAGEITLLDGGTRSASAVAQVDTEVLQLYRRDLLPVLIQHPQVLLQIAQTLCERLRAANSLVEDGLLDMGGRFAAGILRLAKRHGRRTPRGVEIDLAINQRDLGSYLGLSRENTNRQFKRLVRDGVLLIRGGALIIVDESALIARTERVSESRRCERV
jgi:CRP/FNR family transcriptional regulator, cyclic AMP receptor protein